MIDAHLDGRMTYVHLAASGSAYFVPHALLSLGISGILGFFAWRMFALRVRGVRVRGVCVKHTYAKNGVAVVAKFQTVSGETFRCLSPAAAVACARVGDSIDVIYDPRHPKNAEVYPVKYGVAYALSILSLITVVPGIGLLFWMLGS
ncbi:DUF3592 domain-containing protein [Streptomyces sp. NBC_01618]|uniref:DUF3592 domain-containing protein n=1 Tax=Streptomyces sp. NBC_01618 TaxID=2975900 RepID=UPI00387099C4|nr:DUF3592 domain-containing protein [Streptomyces sp. NBC_01618]